MKTLKIEVGQFQESALFTVTADVTSILYLCNIITDSFFKHGVRE